MQKLTLAMLIVVTTFEFFTKGDFWGQWAILPSGSEYIAELSGLIAGIFVIIVGTRNRFQYVRAQYWVVFGALLVTIICGVLINDAGAGPLFTGARIYLRAIPWFFVPAVFAFTHDQVKTQLKILLAVALLQVPLAVQQRLATDAQGSTTGDFTGGTLLISSTMSIFLIGAMCVSAAMFVRGWLKQWQFIVLFVLLLLPTTINETKATLVLLPVCLLVAFLAASRPGRRLRVVLLASALVSAFGAAFFPIYDHYNLERQYTVPLGEWLSDREKLENYLWKTEDIGANLPSGRVDSIVVPFKRMMHDPPGLAFGFGIGNASNSALGRRFVGAHFQTYGFYLSTAIGRILLELGLVGVALVLTMMWLIYKDCRVVYRQNEGMVSTLAAGWAGVTVLMAFALFYKDIIVHTSLSFVFWYFAGLIAAARMRQAPASKRSEQRAAPAE
jgi:hypothetical protein